MNRIVHVFLLSVAFASFVGIIAIAARDHTNGPSVPASVITTETPVATGTSGSPATDQTSTVDAPITTITIASPQAPLSSADPGAGGPRVGATGTTGTTSATGTGRPASFWLLTISYPPRCDPGTAVQPVVSWNAADTDTVAVSVDDPTTVGGYGFFESINTLTMPSIACIGVEGDALPSHEYEIDAFGTDHTVLHVDLTVHITVAASALPNAKQAV